MTTLRNRIFGYLMKMVEDAIAAGKEVSPANKEIYDRYVQQKENKEE